MRRAATHSMHGPVVILCALLALAGACTGERSGDPGTAGPAAVETATVVSAPTITSRAGPAPEDAQPPEVAPGDGRYLIQALQHGMGHIELAQAISSRSDSAVVDDLARTIIGTHNGINGELATIASRVSVTLANDASPELQRTIARLEPLKGRNLDAAYLAALLQLYPDLVTLHGSAATTATNMNVKTVAVRARSLLEGNLTEIRKAYAQVTGNDAPPQPESGSPPPGSAM